MSSPAPAARGGSETTIPLTELLRSVLAAGTERRFGHMALSEDPFYGRVREDEAPRAVEFALDAGRMAAEMSAERWGRDPEAVAAALGVPVERNPEPARAGAKVFMSEYGDRPPKITLHMDSLGRVNEQIEALGLEELLGLSDVVPAHIAHELYHHMEIKQLVAGTAPFRIDSLKVGPLRLQTGLCSLSEIAADSFARALLEMRVCPGALQFITVYSHSPEVALQRLDRLKQFPG